MANQLLLGRALDQNGYPAPGAKATVYLTNTATLIGVFSDVDGSTPAANPIVADGNGYWPQRFTTQTARVVITDADDVTLQTLDPAPTSLGAGSAASEVSFSPTVEVPFTNVQNAIQGVSASVISGVSDFGLGITGNAGLLADLDATNIGAGVYRFDGTTTGTYPTGVVAADLGMVETWRQSATVAMMELHHATTNRVFRRRLTAGVWGAWRESINVNQATAEGDIAYRGASDWARLPKGTAGQALVMNAGATAPEWATSGLVVSAACNPSSTSGTYSRTGTLITVTMVAHGMTTGMSCYLDFTTGAGTDGFYAVTVTGVDTFTVTDAASGATSGNVTRQGFVKASSGISSFRRNSQGRYTFTFTTPFANANYTALLTTGAANDFSTFTAAGFVSDQTTTDLDVYTGTHGATSAPTAVDMNFLNLAIFR